MVFALLLLLPAGLILGFGLAGYGFGALGRVGPRRADRRLWMRSVAALLAAGAVALYTFGLLLVALAVLDAEDGGTDSSPLRPCRTPGQGERALHVVDYTVSYAPLQFVCETTGGGTYAATTVPGCLNPAVLGLALASAACAGTATLRTRRDAERNPDR
ncbi:hypothetical protein [Streptomyces griseorubiginosus]|uniref:hypothetical protein n=1 Tax=Streptomyces griseorubiginosus TaxID=67304 RepID=UPI001AD6180B|nr:hypothetical protein [Streptomyces griseorubiginosus]MBO4253216.1 hypothetical protein [Streptomyces griseorubiginosus]